MSWWFSGAGNEVWLYYLGRWGLKCLNFGWYPFLCQCACYDLHTCAIHKEAACKWEPNFMYSHELLGVGGLFIFALAFSQCTNLVIIHTSFQLAHLSLNSYNWMRNNQLMLLYCLLLILLLIESNLASSSMNMWSFIIVQICMIPSSKDSANIHE